MVKNFEYTIVNLNQNLVLKEKKEFIHSNDQTEPTKTILLTFLKQLVADFESFEGGEEHKQEIEDEI